MNDTRLTLRVDFGVAADPGRAGKTSGLLEAIAAAPARSRRPALIARHVATAGHGS